VALRALTAVVDKGIGWKLGSDLLGRVLQYALLWAAARSLGQANFGDFTFALSIGYMLAQIADFGVQLFVQRELARLTEQEMDGRVAFADEAAASRLIGGGLVIKAGLSAVSLALMAVIVAIEPVGNKGALVLVGLAMVLATGLEYLSYCFRALRRLQYEAIANVIARTANLLLGVGLLLLGAGVLGLAVAANTAMLVAIAFSYRRLTRFVRPTWRPDWAYWRRESMQPTAVGIGIVFSVISFRLDNLLIPALVGREALGVYNAAYKLFEPSAIIPAVVLAGTFPLLSQAAGKEAGNMRDVLRQTLLALAGLGALAGLAIELFAGPAVNLLYGSQYQGSVAVLQILALACLPFYLNYGLTHALIAVNRPQLYAGLTLAAMMTNLVSNLVLIPRMGIEGAAWATVAAEIVLFGCCAWAMVRSLQHGTAPIIERVAEPGVEGLL
jgi:O-antigen/teichoic acid export membrane protein